MTTETDWNVEGIEDWNTGNDDDNKTITDIETDTNTDTDLIDTYKDESYFNMIEYTKPDGTKYYSYSFLESEYKNYYINLDYDIRIETLENINTFIKQQFPEQQKEQYPEDIITDIFKQLFGFESLIKMNNILKLFTDCKEPDFEKIQKKLILEYINLGNYTISYEGKYCYYKKHIPDKTHKIYDLIKDHYFGNPNKGMFYWVTHDELEIDE